MDREGAECKKGRKLPSFFANSAEVAKNSKYSFSLENKNEAEHRGCMTAIHQAIETGLFSFIDHPGRSFRRVKVWNEECTALSRAVIESAAEKGGVLEKNLSSVAKLHIIGFKCTTGTDAEFHAIQPDF